MLRGVMESAMDVEVERGPRIFKPDVRTQRNNVSTPTSDSLLELCASMQYDIDALYQTSGKPDMSIVTVPLRKPRAA